MRPLLLLLLGAISTFSQPFSIGAKVGLPLTDFIDATGSPNANGFIDYATHTNRYIVGVGAELRLPFHLGLELDALYRHYDFQSTNAGQATVVESTSSNAFEFPLLAKFTFGTKILHPFVDAGVAWDTLEGLKQDVTTTVQSITGSTSSSSSSTSSPSQLQHTTTRGYVFGGGLDIHFLLIHIQPEIRYTRWGAQHFLDPNGLLHSNENQGEFLLGISF